MTTPLQRTKGPQPLSKAPLLPFTPLSHRRACHPWLQLLLLGPPTFWVPGTASGVCVGQPLMIFMVQPSPVSLQPSGKPPPPPQVAVPCATCSPVVSAPWYPGQEALFNFSYLFFLFFLSFLLNIFVSFIYIALFPIWHLILVLFSSLWCFS